MTLPARHRSLLAVPGSSEKMVNKAAGLDADIVMLDLEDGVAPEAKTEARARVAHLLVALDWGTRGRAVRVNGRGTGLLLRDLEAVLPGRPDLLVVPKVESAADVAFVVSLVEEINAAHGASGAVGILAIVETPLGVLAAPAIATTIGVEALLFGSADYASAMGISETPGRQELDVARASVALAAHAHGRLAFDAAFYAQLDNQDSLEADARRGRSFGYQGKAVLHPTHLATVNRVFGADEREVAWARHILEAYEAESAGRGAIRVDGQMVDAPMLARARQILAGGLD